MVRLFTLLAAGIVYSMGVHGTAALAESINCPGPIFRGDGTFILYLTGPGYQPDDFVYLNRFPNGNVRADVKISPLSAVDGWLVMQLYSDQLGNNFPHLGRVQDVEVGGGRATVRTLLDVEFTNRLVANVRLRYPRTNGAIRYQVNFESNLVECFDDGEDFPSGAVPDRLMLRYGSETLQALLSLEGEARLKEELAAARSMAAESNIRAAELGERVVSLERQSAEDARMIENARRVIANYEQALRKSEQSVKKLEQIATKLQRGMMVYTPAVAKESTDADTKRRLLRIVRWVKRQIAIISNS